MSEAYQKDINRYSFSRFKTFQTCPLKHHYSYIEQITGEESAYLIMGRFFHAMIEEYYKYNRYPTQSINEYKQVILNYPSKEMDPYILEYVFKKYISFYAESDKTEEVLLVEETINDKLEVGEEYIQAKIDRVIKKKGTEINILRDTKTTSDTLKYSYADVAGNQQLMFYVPFAEDHLQEIDLDLYPISEKISAIEVDEVRLAYLDDVPINKNGKPTADRKRLTLVTYEEYYKVLASMNLLLDDEYQDILTFLEQRGHPLFRRINSQILDEQYIQSNLNDMKQVYDTIHTGVKYRSKGYQCNSCPFKSLCELDYSNPSEESRNILIEQITKKSVAE